MPRSSSEIRPWLSDRRGELTALGEVPEHLQESFQAIQDALEHGWYRPNVPYWSAARDAMNEAVRRIIEGGEDVRTVLDELHGDIAAAAERAGAEYPPSD